MKAGCLEVWLCGEGVVAGVVAVHGPCLFPGRLFALCYLRAPLRTTKGLLWPLEKLHSSGLFLLSGMQFIDPFSFQSNTDSTYPDHDPLCSSPYQPLTTDEVFI